MVHLAGPADRREGREAVRGRLPGHQGRGPPDRLSAHPPARDAGAPGESPARRRDPHFRRRPLRAAQGKEAADEVHAARRRRVSGGFQGPGRLLLRLRATVNVIAYNTKLVPAAEAPKGWKDVLDPKWKGKLVTAHPGYSGVISTHVLALVHLHGWEYFKQLAQNKLMLVQSAVDPAGVVASGERQVAVNGGDYYYYQMKKKGNPIEVVYPKEGVPLVVSPTAIAGFAPHPNAAKLFTDFTFSRELQQVMADSEGLYTGHPEVKYPTDKPKLSELKLLTVDPDELEKRNEEIKNRFVEFFGA
ncbi:MAG: hypothetical protein DMD96_30995 [Candidatus Rokuibacteriota bacterium]|nr:MAG: hypothetical protein DMD96_30995 [Candidatus Rokubacteria bacterium]